MLKLFFGAAIVWVSIFSCLRAESAQESSSKEVGKGDDSFFEVFNKLRASKPEGTKPLQHANISSPKGLEKEKIPSPKQLGGLTAIGVTDSDASLPPTPLPLSELEKPEGLSRQSYKLDAPTPISLGDMQIEQPYQLEIADHEKHCFNQWPPKEGNVIVNHYKEKNWFESVEGELDYPTFSPLETMIHQHACWMKCDGKVTLKEMRVNGLSPPSPGVAAKTLSLSYDSYRTLTKTRAKQLIVFIVQSLFQTLMSKDAALHPALDPTFNLMSLEVLIVNKSALVAYADPDTFRRVYLSQGMVFFDPWEKPRTGNCCNTVLMQGEPYNQILEEVRITCEAAAQ